MSVQFPPCPSSLKAIQHYLKTASEHDQRDPVISYWCRLYALQLGLKTDRKSDEAKILLTSLMDWLEKTKRLLSDNEAVTNDVAAQAHIENYAYKLFLYADSQDRAANFGKNVVKAFYTAGNLFDVLATFGELTEEVVQNQKYAKWKAAYIHNCLKNGEIPIPGPLKDEYDDLHDNQDGSNNADEIPGPSNIGFVPQSNYQAPDNSDSLPANLEHPESKNGQYCPTCGCSHLEGLCPNMEKSVLNPELMTKAQKYCKWAGSALTYDDVPTAINNLEKALRLLKTGVDS